MRRVILFFLVLMWSASVSLALPHSEVEKLIQSDADFARVEQALLDTWKMLPKDVKRKARSSQMEWINTERDKEADELMGMGFTFAQAYTLSTAVRNNIIAELLSPNLKSRAVIFDLEALGEKYLPTAQAEQKRRKETAESEASLQKEGEDQRSATQTREEQRKIKVAEAEERERKAALEVKEKQQAAEVLAAKEKAEAALAASFFNAPPETVNDETAYSLTVAFARDPARAREKLKTFSADTLRILQAGLESSRPDGADETPLTAMVADLAGDRIYGLQLVGQLGSFVSHDEESGADLIIFHPLEGDEALALSLEPTLVDHRSDNGDLVAVYCRGHFERDCSVMKIEDHQSPAVLADKAAKPGFDLFQSLSAWWPWLLGLIVSGFILFGLIVRKSRRNRPKAAELKDGTDQKEAET